LQRHTFLLKNIYFRKENYTATKEVIQCIPHRCTDIPFIIFNPAGKVPVKADNRNSFSEHISKYSTDDKPRVQNTLTYQSLINYYSMGLETAFSEQTIMIN
jgi:hypothetical protein